MQSSERGGMDWEVLSRSSQHKGEGGHRQSTGLSEFRLLLPTSMSSSNGIPPVFDTLRHSATMLYQTIMRTSTCSFCHASGLLLIRSSANSTMKSLQILQNHAFAPREHLIYLLRIRVKPGIYNMCCKPYLRTRHEPRHLRYPFILPHALHLPSSRRSAGCS